MSFDAMRRFSEQQTAKVQAELGEREARRIEAARAAVVLEAKQAAANKLAAQQRREAMLERERLAQIEQTLRDQQPPKTVNLHALKAWRKSQGLPEDGSQDPPTLPNHRATSAKSTSSVKVKAKSSSSKLSKVPKEPLTREEKQAKHRADLFADDSDDTTGGMALARLQNPRRLVKSSSAPSLKSTKAHRPVASSSSLPSFAPPKKQLSARDRLTASSDFSQLKKLNTVKKDMRNIDEIERDMKRKKEGLPPLSKSNSTSNSSTSTSASTSKKRDRPLPPSQDSSKRAKPSSSSRNAHYSSEEESDSGSSHYGRSTGSGVSSRVSSQIQQIMRGGRAPLERRVEYSDGDSDMEATGADMLREEAAASRMAAREDAEEQERLRVHAERKRLRLAGGERRG